jgi:hypothetical protein
MSWFSKIRRVYAMQPSLARLAVKVLLLLFFITWLCDLAEYYGELRWLLYFAFFAVVLALFYSYAGVIVRWLRRFSE